MRNGAPNPLRITLFSLLAIAVAQQQQHATNNADGYRGSPSESPSIQSLAKDATLDDVSMGLASTYKPKKETLPLLRNERAVATIAPAESNPAVRAPLARTAAGGLTPHRARSLQDWEVENFVLLATVDGSIYARDRSTGKELWKFYSEKPMVETVYHRKKRTPFPGRSGDPETDDFMWIVEPNEAGSLYVITPSVPVQVQKLGLTVKQLAEDLSPYASEESPFVYTAEKKNTLITLNATNGAALKYFSAGGAGVVGARSCRKVSGLGVDDDDDECEATPTIHLGRTDYTVGIQDRDTGENICTIKYFEWTPNNRDRDLQAQYSSTMDSKYIYSRFDGGIIALEHGREDKSRALYSKKFTHSPVVRVFDVARPQGADAREVPLVILPQPIAPAMSVKLADNVFLNCTDDGSWYALSETSYPSVTDGAKAAECYRKPLTVDGSSIWEGLDDDRDVKPSELVGVHSLSDDHNDRRHVPMLIGPPPAVDIPLVKETVNETGSIQHASTVKPSFFSANTSWTIGGAFLCIVFTYLATRSVGLGGLARPAPTVKPTEHVALTIAATPPVNRPIEATPAGLAVEHDMALEPAPSGLPVAEVAVERKVRFDTPMENEATEDEQQAVERAESNETGEDDGNVMEDAARADDATDDATATETPKKRKTHRGQRGGKKRNKNKNQDKADAEQVNKIVEAVVAPEPQALQPVEQTVLDEGVQDVSGNVQIGKLTVHVEKTLGFGSGGTVVFEGLFEGKEVAIKRMLLQYFDLASQEVSLLQQSDDDPNVIRYFCHEKGRDFLYIAVERCQASLWDLFKEGGAQDGLSNERLKLVNDINSNVSNILYQLASGLNHLHNNRIIHRDIKPQNILIAFPKKIQKHPVRLVISDFGLCRTLPDNVSTLAGTMGNAGTIGWKAPELIGQPRDSTNGGSSLNENSSKQGNNNSLGSDNGNSNNTSSSGVKRAVDIFSLGCVFYYVLTNGAHPFDSDNAEVWHVERELNIKRGNRNFRKLEDLGGDAEEPMHLIEWMLSPKPEWRPTARQVLTHPFFWRPDKRLSFLCDVSDHFEREPRDPPSADLETLEYHGQPVHGGDFLRRLDRKFIDTLGKQRKYTGDRMLDLLRALRNKKNHYADMPEDVQLRVGPLPGGYLNYWTGRFPGLLMACWECVRELELFERDARFAAYLEVQGSP